MFWWSTGRIGARWSANRRSLSTTRPGTLSASNADSARAAGSQAVKLVPRDWRWTDIGPVAEWMEACDPCAVDRERINRVELEALGIDPDSVAHENRNGRIPEPMARTGA